MALPKLTFFCELESQALQDLFDDPKIIEYLVNSKAGVSLGLLDLSPARADVVMKLNRAAIPVTAWLLLPRQEGYWLNIDNASQARNRYREFKEWTRENGLSWIAVGLDVEPDIRDLQEFGRDRVDFLKRLLKRAFDRNRLFTAQSDYANLVELIRSDGYFVESYQLPIIADERLMGSSIIRRLTGIFDISVDREVWMLYSSLLGEHGAGMLWSYAPNAQAIGLGSTGGGVDIGFGNFRDLSWDELARDLRLAWHWNNNIYIFSLEGCIKNGYLPRLEDFTWDMPILFPEGSAQRIRGWRNALQITLWIVSHFTVIFALTLGILALLIGMRRWLIRKTGNRS